MTDERKKFGVSGERLAADYLKKKGYEIVATNWRCKMGEIDLIAKSGNMLAFCEVKTRKSDRYGRPIEAITAAKQAKVRRLGEYYWSFQTDRTLMVRFDAISIFDNGQSIDIEHIEDAF